MSHTLLILKIYTTFKDVQMILKRFYNISTGFRFSKNQCECSVHSCSCPWPIYQKDVETCLQNPFMLLQPCQKSKLRAVADGFWVAEVQVRHVKIGSKSCFGSLHNYRTRCSSYDLSWLKLKLKLANFCRIFKRWIEIRNILNCERVRN